MIWVSICLSIHLLVGILVVFNVLAIVNNTAVNTYVGESASFYCQLLMGFATIHSTKQILTVYLHTIYAVNQDIIPAASHYVCSLIRVAYK
jgi:hypothetical protein